MNKTLVCLEGNYCIIEDTNDRDVLRKEYDVLSIPLKYCFLEIDPNVASNALSKELCERKMVTHAQLASYMETWLKKHEYRKIQDECYDLKIANQRSEKQYNEKLEQLEVARKNAKEDFLSIGQEDE